MTETETTRNEKISLSLAALILSLIGLFCALFDGWRIIGMVLSALGIIVAAYSMTRLQGARGSRRMSVAAIITALVAGGIAAWFLFIEPKPPVIQDRDILPSELTDSASLQRDQEESVNQLKNLIDTSQAQ
jgi:predicted PurR-regulated permease PerM